MSWWDYGYQIAGMANRTTLVDNNTWNNSHIAMVTLYSMYNQDILLEVLNYTFALSGRGHFLWCTYRIKSYLSVRAKRGFSGCLISYNEHCRSNPLSECSFVFALARF